MPAPDNPASLLYTKIILQNDVTRYGGYHRDLFTRKFTILEEALIICTLCQGVKKDASIFQGVATCRCCSYNPDKATPIKDIRDLVARLPMRCPLYARGCNWTGNVREGEGHLFKCKELLCICPNECEIGVTRRSLEQHYKSCQMRKIPCDYCGNQVTAKKLEEHFLVCALGPIACTQCSAKIKRSELAEHLSSNCTKIREKEITNNNVMKNQHEKAEVSSEIIQTVSTEKVVSENYESLERETAELRERVSSLEKKNEILTKALFIKPELMKFDSSVGRFLEGFKWSIFGIGNITKSVSRMESPTFYIWYRNMKLIGEVGILGSISFSIARVDGQFDDIIGTNTLSYYRCELVPADQGEPLVLNGRINHKLEIHKGQQFLFIDLSLLMDQLYCLEDTITLNIYFDITY